MGGRLTQCLTGSITPLLPIFKSLLQASGSRSEPLTARSSRSSASSSSSSRCGKPTLKISVYYTRALTHLDAQALHLKDSNIEGSLHHTAGHCHVHGHTSTLHHHHPARRERSHYASDASHHRPFPPGVTITASRPSILHVLSNFMDRTIETLPCQFAGDEEKRRGMTSGKGVLIGVCGPASLAEDTRRAIGSLDEGKRQSVGGLEVVEE